MTPWRCILNGVDITQTVSKAQARFDADNVCGEISVDLADRTVLNGIVLPRVPRELVIAVDAFVNGEWVSRGRFFMEEIEHPQNPNARTASIWGRSLAARLLKPWAPKISKQWPAATSIAAILQELAALCGMTIVIQNDYPVCQYCYAVSDWYPSQIVQDLAEKSGQICWPQIDGSLLIAPRLYRDLPAPVVTLVANQIEVQGVRRRVPDFGNRILISGDGVVAGLSVQVVPMADEDACVVADGTSQVRLIAIVTGADGLPVALGTEVEWSASSGLMSAQTSPTQSVVRQAEVHKADDYTHLTLDMPAVSVVGAYRRTDIRKARNYYAERGGSVSGRVITFSAPLDYYDQTLVVDYIVAGAPITWTAGRVPGDVTVLASVAGAQGYATLHQSNPTACATQISLEASPSNPCLGDTVAILLKSTMFGGAGVGSAVFGLQGCGSLSSTRKSLAPRQITETLRTSVWGGAVEVRLTAVPVAGTTPSVVLTETPGGNLYESHTGQTVILSDDTILPGTQVTVTYIAGGTAMVAWKPSALPAGFENIVETLEVVHVGTPPDDVAQVTLTRTPVAAPLCVPVFELDNFYASHDNKVVTLLEDGGVILPVGTQVQCAYQSVWPTQAGCSAIITVRVDDGSEDGGRGQIAVSARDCRTVNPSGGSGSGSTYDPEDPDQIPDETTDPDGDDEDVNDDPTSWLEPEEEEVTPTGCGPGSINKRTPVITKQNFGEVFGVPGVEQCDEDGGVCSCDEICTALRSSGRLSTEGNMTYSTCMQACQQTRSAKCTPCELTGPATLGPGEEGTWTDGKTNSGEWKGGPVALVERKFDTGYKAKMPTGGEGPFTVQVCYGEDARTCCEAEVDFPPCSISGPSSLDPDEEGAFVPSLGMAGAEAVGNGMVIVRTTADAVIAKLADHVCSGSLTISYGGRVCDTKNVASTMAAEVGAIAGPDGIDPGETAYFAVEFPSGNTDDLEYTGQLEYVSGNSSGAILRMPSDATGTYTISWTASCGRSVSKAVSAYDECWEAGEPHHVGEYLPIIPAVQDGQVWHQYYQMGTLVAQYGPFPTLTPQDQYSSYEFSGGKNRYTSWNYQGSSGYRYEYAVISVESNPCG